MARSILVIVSHVHADPTAGFHDLGGDFYSTSVNTQRRTRNLVHQVEVLGPHVTLTPTA
ncbi:MAG: hypothetical protein AB1673_06625 [Actinomycetota bacterium]